ncbi:MAG: hypothetical protein HY796_07730 [Elusimicrobia bacterium]|nr:hypothetical protein [Elusimicrobiota bacterium]
MRKKTDSIILAIITAISVILPHAPKIIPEGNSLIAAAAVAATLSIPSKSMAAIMPARIVQLAVTMPQSCEAGVMEQLCSSVTSFLNDEAAKADTALKNCKKNCGWRKRKDDLIDAARKKAKESCAKGEAPDVNELSKGLDRNTKDRLKDLYNRNSRMFDGTAKLAAKDLTLVPSNSAATLTAKGGQVADLKSYEPNTPKLKYPKDAAKQSDCYTLCTGITAGAAAQCKCCQDYNSLCTTYVSGCTPGCGEYDAKKSCCINGKVVDKFKVPSKTLQRIGVIPDCKNRVQAVSEKVVRPEKQGCSVTPRLGHLINIKERRFSRDERLIALMLSWKITKGIATKLFNLDSGRPPITDFNNPFTGLTPPFRGSCNDHDYCYGTCKKIANDSADRRKCDDKLLTDLRDVVCSNAKYPLTKDECTELAEDMVWSLRHLPFGGSAAYAAAQIERCKCDLCP